MAKSLVLRLCQISRSSFYYKPQEEPRKAGRVCSTTTIKLTGGYESDNQVVEDIKALLAQEFVDYGYYKTTIYLRQAKKYYINPKKVYRLMNEHGLLNLTSRAYSTTKRQWVKELVPNPKAEFMYFERSAAAVRHQVHLRSCPTCARSGVNRCRRFQPVEYGPIDQMDYAPTGCSHPIRDAL